jgi:hypothetical protein
MIIVSDQALPPQYLFYVLKRLYYLMHIIICLEWHGRIITGNNKMN